MSEDKISPSKSFTDKVMVDVKKRPRKIGLWNLAYIIPIALAIALLVTPASREALVNTTDTQHSAVYDVQEDVDDIQDMIDELSSFDSAEMGDIQYASTPR